MHADVVAGRLPAELTSFVGRRAELRDLRGALSTARLVTMTGIGGVGKTRLATHLASQLRRAFADGVTFVDLSTVSDPEWIDEYIAEVLGLQARSPQPAVVSLVEYLEPRSVLLVIDNCEHVVDAAAILVDTLLRTCPRLRVLATSREPLRIQAEIVRPVSPLGTSDEHAAGTSESVVLFAERARARVAEFVVNDQNREDVSAICRKLEGIPLAIELAASQLSAMSPRELDSCITDQWDLLRHGSRTAPPRQQTMASCIEWSYDLCDEAERDLWGQLSIFQGGFERDAVESVCSGGEVMHTLACLVDKSIVIADARGDATRYRLLPPIRERGLSRLREIGALTEIRRAHRDWCADLAQTVNDEWVSARQVAWIERLRRESPNIREALEFCATTPGEAAAGLMIGANLVEFAITEGLVRQGRRWSDALLDLAPEQTPARAMALRASCWWAALQGDLTAAARFADEQGEIAATIGGRALSLHHQSRGLVAQQSGRPDEAVPHYLRALEGLRGDDDSAQAALTLCLLGLNYVFVGDSAAALQAHRECMAITEPAGESWYRSYSLWIAGLAAWLMGDHAAALNFQSDSLRLKRILNEPLGLGYALEAMAWLEVDLEPARAAKLLGAAEDLWARVETSAHLVPGLEAHNQECVLKLTAALGDDGAMAEMEAGRSMSLDEALAFALREAEPRSVSRTRASRSAPTTLTKREVEVAQLVHEGLTNQQIAERLVISKRTAETHVEHILTKLGMTNRQQIATWVVDDRELSG